MVNISLLEKSIPVAPIKIAALDSCHELAQKVDSHLVQFRQELDSHNKSGLSFRGYSEDTFLIESKCPRFGSGEAKGVINESVHALFGSTPDQGPKAAKYTVLPSGRAGSPTHTKRSEGRDSTPT